MPNIDIKVVRELIESFGPTNEQRQKFSQTFVGTLFGQSVVLVGMLVTYFSAVVLLKKTALQDLVDLQTAFGEVWFLVVVAAPFIFILLFSMLPTLWRTMRERRLKATLIGGDLQFKPGYFRLHPYGKADRETFERLDGASATILNWLRSTEVPVLYLTGASGVGKSSLVAADVLPRLRDDGWAVVEARLLGNPMERLRVAMLEAMSLFGPEPNTDLSLRDLFERAAKARANRDAAVLLLVIDQFEEFLILQNEDQRKTFVAFLVDLVNNPIDGLRLLLIFRSDYQPLIFKLELPPLVSGENWQEVAPYDRGEATSFLLGGGRELASEALDALFRGLDRIEQTRGIYRPITLNMVGLVLERMGRTLVGDPAKFIQSYLTFCLTAGPSRDFSKSVLAKMITDEGTKEPRSEANLAALTGFESWQVKATLADLSRLGLVRRLEGAVPVWEIGHDFLARTIGQLIGRLKPTVVQRVRPAVAPVVLLGWIALAVLGLPFWNTTQERRSEEALRAMGANFSKAIPNGISVAIYEKVREDVLKVAVTHLKRLRGLRALDFYLDDDVTSLEPLKELTNLRSLSLLSGKFTGLEPLKALTNLSDLTISGGYITTLEPLKGLTNLRHLSIVLSGIASLEPLSGLKDLGWLQLNNNLSLTSLDPLKGLTNLSDLSFGGCPVTSLDPLKGLTSLRRLSLAYSRITNLNPLKGLTNLSDLDLSGVRGITSLEPLEWLTNLSDLNLTEATGITSLEPLEGLTNLSDLNLTEATGITSLEPLKGKKIRIFASEELLATIK